MAYSTARSAALIGYQQRQGGSQPRGVGRPGLPTATQNNNSAASRFLNSNVGGSASGGRFSDFLPTADRPIGGGINEQDVQNAGAAFAFDYNRREEAERNRFNTTQREGQAIKDAAIQGANDIRQSGTEQGQYLQGEADSMFNKIESRISNYESELKKASMMEKVNASYGVQKNYQGQIDQIESDPDMTPQQKAAAKQQLTQQSMEMAQTSINQIGASFLKDLAAYSSAATNQLVAAGQTSAQMKQMGSQMIAMSNMNAFNAQLQGMTTAAQLLSMPFNPTSMLEGVLAMNEMKASLPAPTMVIGVNPNG